MMLQKNEGIICQLAIGYVVLWCAVNNCGRPANNAREEHEHSITWEWTRRPLRVITENITGVWISYCCSVRSRKYYIHIIYEYTWYVVVLGGKRYTSSRFFQARVV